MIISKHFKWENSRHVLPALTVGACKRPGLLEPGNRPQPAPNPRVKSGSEIYFETRIGDLERRQVLVRNCRSRHSGVLHSYWRFLCSRSFEFASHVIDFFDWDSSSVALITLY